MVKLFSELEIVQNKCSLLHREDFLFLKILLLIITIISRFTSIYLMFSILVFNILLLIYIGVRRILLFIFILWLILSSIVVLIDMLFSTLTVNVLFNLVYGLTTFTGLILFYSTTPPSHIENIIGLNTFSLTYLFLNHYVKQVVEMINILRARGLDLTLNIWHSKYLMRIIVVFIVFRINELLSILKARGVEE
ncbi:MAG: hypothetical protein QW607_04000 [Desulfurococcaceae archaeon]